MRADAVLYNGTLRTLDPAQPIVSALALAGERVVALGDDAAMRDLLAPGGEAVDLFAQHVEGFAETEVEF